MSGQQVRWSTSVFRGFDGAIRAAENQTTLELIINIAKELDAALYEVIYTYLPDPESQRVGILKKRGRTLADKIQLAGQMDLLFGSDIRVLDAFRELRNVAAHELPFTVGDQNFQTMLASLKNSYLDIGGALQRPEGMTDEQYIREVLVALQLVYSFAFHELLENHGKPVTAPDED